MINRNRTQISLKVVSLNSHLLNDNNPARAGAGGEVTVLEVNMPHDLLNVFVHTAFLTEVRFERSLEFPVGERPTRGQSLLVAGIGRSLWVHQTARVTLVLLTACRRFHFHVDATKVGFNKLMMDLHV